MNITVKLLYTKIAVRVGRPTSLLNICSRILDIQFRYCTCAVKCGCPSLLLYIHSKYSWLPKLYYNCKRAVQLFTAVTTWTYSPSNIYCDCNTWFFFYYTCSVKNMCTIFNKNDRFCMLTNLLVISQ